MTYRMTYLRRHRASGHVIVIGILVYDGILNLSRGGRRLRDEPNTRGSARKNIHVIEKSDNNYTSRTIQNLFYYTRKKGRRMRNMLLPSSIR